MDSEDLKPFYILILISFGLIICFFITIDWSFISTSILTSFLGIGGLWYKKPPTSKDNILNRIDRRATNLNLSLQQKEEMTNDYLQLRVNYFADKNNVISFSILTFAILLSGIFVIFYSSDLFEIICRGLKESSILHSFKFFGEDYGILGIFLLFIAGSSLIYLSLSTRFRYEFNRIVEIQLRDY